MARLDDRILECLCREGTLRPSDIEAMDSVDCTASYVGRRLCELRDRGLVSKREDTTRHEITDEGKAYLIGVYDVSREAYIHEQAEGSIRDLKRIQLALLDGVDFVDHLYEGTEDNQVGVVERM